LPLINDQQGRFSQSVDEQKAQTLLRRIPYMANFSSSNTSKPGRRKILKLGVASGVATASHGLLSGKTSNEAAPTLYLQPFLDPLPIPPIKTPTTLVPAPDRLPVPGEAGREEHQRFEEFRPQIHYEVKVRAGRHHFHSHLPEEEIWGYDGILPGPVFVNRIGVPVAVRFRNELPQHHVGFGSPEIITHLHGGHVGSSSDGFAGDYYSVTKAGPALSQPGAFYDHHYPNIPHSGDIRDITNTLWYHDHREEFTAPNVYKGLAGFYLLFDHLDTGDETTGLRLPSGVGRYDVPLLIQDKKFDSGGNLFFDQFSPEGFLGNQFCVNGKVQPYYRVEGRKYRFRMLNGSVARYFEMYLTDERDRNQDFTFIASDGNLLARPLTLQKFLMCMAERADIIIDFSRYAPGTVLYLVNRMAQDEPRKPSGNRLYPGIRLLRFEVGERTRDNSVIPASLRELPARNLAGVAKTRVWKFERGNGQWAINGKFFDPERADAVVKRDKPEIWNLDTNGGWAHPIHVHLEDFRILSINGQPPPPEWSGRKDTISLLPGWKAEILVHFSDFTGKYLMHCHQTAHEDHAMMIRFDVVP
jgi:FtsP/CotA-like multicopper oxidase with cupredoxin domain